MPDYNLTLVVKQRAAGYFINTGIGGFGSNSASGIGAGVLLHKHK